MPSMQPELTADSSARVQRSSTSSVCGISTGVTPHSSAICCTDVWWCESPTIGLRGRRRATADAVRPVKVVVDRGCYIPENLVIGEDAELDARRFYRSDQGVVLVSAEMLAALG